MTTSIYFIVALILFLMDFKALKNNYKPFQIAIYCLIMVISIGIYYFVLLNNFSISDFLISAVQ